MDLESAMRLAMNTLSGEKDLNGGPQVLHAFVVLVALEDEDDDVRIAAVLHDVVEDSETTLEDLRSLGCSEKILSAIDALTKREGEPYDIYLARCKADPVAKIVKVADSAHNLKRCLKCICISKGGPKKDVFTNLAQRYMNNLNYLKI